MSQVTIDADEIKNKALELWEEAGKKASWQCGLVDRIAKTLMHYSITRDLSDKESAMIEAALHNYAMRKVLLGLV